MEIKEAEFEIDGFIKKVYDLPEKYLRLGNIRMAVRRPLSYSVLEEDPVEVSISDEILFVLKGYDKVKMKAYFTALPYQQPRKEKP